MNKAFEQAYNFLKAGTPCKLSRDNGVWACIELSLSRGE